MSDYAKANPTYGVHSLFALLNKLRCRPCGEATWVPILIGMTVEVGEGKSQNINVVAVEVLSNCKSTLKRHPGEGRDPDNHRLARGVR